MTAGCFFCNAAIKSRTGPSGLGWGRRAFASATSRRFTSRMRSRTFTASFPFQLLREGDELLHLLLRRAALDHLACLRDAALHAVRAPRDIDRRAGVEG